MKFRAIVTQYFSFTDSSQNNPKPGSLRAAELGPGSSCESGCCLSSLHSWLTLHHSLGREEQSQLGRGQPSRTSVRRPGVHVSETHLGAGL